MTESRHDRRFPNESTAYREARNALLEAEIALRAQAEAVAAQRRALPPGGAVPDDYVFEEIGDDGQPRAVRLSSLFGDKPSLVVYSFMYGPGMAEPCPYCTSFLDSLDAATPHIRQQTSLAVVARSAAERLAAWQRSRCWKNLRLVSSAGNRYNVDYQAESSAGDQLPILNVFARTDDGIEHTWASEMLFAPMPGGHPRHVDLLWPVWQTFDLIPEGRGNPTLALHYED